MNIIKEGHQLYHKSNDKAIPARAFTISGNIVIVHKYSSDIELPIDSVGICDIYSEDVFDILNY